MSKFDWVHKACYINYFEYFMQALMSGKTSREVPHGEDKATRTRGSGSVAKRALFIPLVAILLLMIYTTSVMFKPTQLDASVIDTSDRHVAELIQQWQKDKDRERREKMENRTQIIPNTLLKTEIRRQEKVYKNRPLTQRQFEINYLKNKFDEETRNLANHTSGRPIYTEYDLSPAFIDSRRGFDCVQLKTVPPTPICLYDSKYDVFVSKQIRELGIWEGHIVDQFQKVLSMDSYLGVIDIGANLGQYSLIAAKMGHNVLAVEPWKGSLERFREAANMAGIKDKITVLTNVISDERSRVCLKTTGDNQGNVHIDMNREESYNMRLKSCNSSNSVYLDDLLPYINFQRAVLKLDIQGFEHRAFLHAKTLLKELYIPYIFMEWVIMREFWVTASHETLDKAIVRFLVRQLTDLDYRVFSLISRKELDIRYWHGWPEDVVWIHKTQIKQNKNPLQR